MLLTLSLLVCFKDMRGVLQLKGHNTATYCAVITGTGELTFGLGDMEIHQQITEQYVRSSYSLLIAVPGIDWIFFIIVIV